MTKCEITTGLNARPVFATLHSFTRLSAVIAYAFAAILGGSGSISAADNGTKSGTKTTVKVNSAAAIRSAEPLRTPMTPGKQGSVEPGGVVEGAGGGGIIPEMGEGEIKPQPLTVNLAESPSTTKVNRTVELSPGNAAEGISSIRLQTDGKFVAGGASTAVGVPVVLNSLVKEFRTASDDYVATQKELTRKLKGASAEEKARLREALQANKEKFSHSTAPLREQLHDRLEELKRDLKEHSQAISAGAGGGAGGGRRRGGD